MSSVPSRLADQLHEEALAIVARYKTCEFDLVEVLQKIDRHQIYLSRMFRSLYQYATEGLGLSEEIAYAFINVARKSNEIPALKEEIKSGALTVAKAKRITAVLTRENQNHWLELARTSTKQKLEREIAMASPVHAVADQLKYIHPTAEKSDSAQVLNLGQTVRVQLQAGISERLMLDIRRVQELISQRLRRPATLEDVIKAMVAEYLHKHDPVQIAARRKTSDPEKPVKIALKNQVMLKYQGQCAYKNKYGERCSKKTFLDVHHILPQSEGGTDDLGNLQLLCSGHHKMVHH